MASSKKSLRKNLTAGRKPNITRKLSETKSPEGQEASKSSAAEGGEIALDRRRRGDRRAESERRRKNEPVAVERRKIQRRAKVNRRRQIDPTTCERDYTVDEVEFMNALDHYKRTSGRMFPTCSEILEVIRGLGYVKQPAVVSQVEGPSDTPEGAIPADIGCVPLLPS